MLFQRKKQRGMVSAIVAAGGSSQRMGENKLLMELYGIPVLARTLLTLDGCREIDEIILVCREEDMGDYLALTEDYSIQKIKTIAVGGKTRQQSVFAGVRAASEDAAYDCIHDGARPLASRQVIAGVLEAAQREGAATAAVKAKDTIKIAGPDGFILSTPDRDSLYLTQTPQVFEASLYREAMEAALAAGKEYTDDCQLVEAIGRRVYLAGGDYANIKLTTPEDQIVAEALLEYAGE